MNNPSPIEKIDVQRLDRKRLLAIFSVLFIFVFIFLVVNTLEQTSEEEIGESSEEANTKNDTERFDEPAVDLDTLIEKGYVYYNNERYSKALEVFNEALQYAEEQSFEYYLISAEIALLNDNATAALLAYEQAYEIEPRSIDINSNLAYFYSGYEESTLEYLDYEKALFYNLKVYRLLGVENGSEELNVAISYFYLDKPNKVIELLEDFDFEEYPYAAVWIAGAYYYLDNTVEMLRYIEIAEDNGAEVPIWLKGDMGDL